jgi:hypothetical protein
VDQSTGELIERLSRLELQQAKLQRSNKHLRMRSAMDAGGIRSRRTIR